MSELASSWTCAPYPVAASRALVRELGLHPVTASILVRRGHDTPARARAFLAGGERHDPLALSGMGAAVELLVAHAARGSRIVIHGDYDVDGVCSTAVLVRALRRLGAEPVCELPSRFEDGYGLSAAGIERMAAAATDLLVTVDCGITAVDEVALARERGIEVIVTDHHRPGERLPDCPVVHPALGDYPFAELCAAGVAFKLAEALTAATGADPAPLADDLDLVALATICDVVPLVGENRRLVREGLAALARTRKPGLRALMRVAACEAGALDAGAVGFRLGPRLNAAGRLRRPDAALELLLTEDERRADEVAGELDLLNRERRETESRISFAAEAALAEHAHQPAYVLAGEGWHPGVIGIVASRLVERHCRPCVLIALDGDSGRGSGRSIPAFDLHAGLAACAGHLRRFGGHRMAAGFDVEADSVDALRRDFVRHAAAVLAPGDLRRRERVDALAPGDALGLPLAEELERLAPFGHANPRPTLLVPAARIEDPRSMGEDAQHARFSVASGGARARAVAFRTSARSLKAAGEAPQDVAVRLELNEWNGSVEPRLVLRALSPSRAGRFAVLDERLSVWDCVRTELVRPLGDWCVANAAVGPRATQPPARSACDRRGEGTAGVLGDLLASGESVLVLCVDPARRRAPLERLLGGLAVSEPALASWDLAATRPELAAPYPHVYALDPPPHPDGETLLAALPGDGHAHLGWGPAEQAFALELLRAQLDLRGRLAALYRALRDGAAEPLDQRFGAFACARLVRILVELGLASFADGAEPALRLTGAERSELERSAAFRAYRTWLAVGSDWLAAGAERAVAAA